MTRKKHVPARARSIEWWAVLGIVAILSTLAAVMFMNQESRQAPEPSVRTAAAMRTTAPKSEAVASVDAREPGRNFGGNRNLETGKTRQPGRFVPRGLWREDDPNLADIASLKFNLLTVNPNRPDLNRLRNNGLKGLIWLGGYDSDDCEFNESNAWVRGKVKALGRHRAAYAWFIDDEPHAECPKVRAQIRGRSKLIKKNHPGALTVVSENRTEAFDELANTTDVMVIVSYPCSQDDGCVYSKIAEDVRAAKNAGVRRFWGAIQAFGEEYYKLPSPGQTRELFRRWKRAGVRGYLAYIWRSDGEDEVLEDHEELWDAWTTNNSRPLR